MNKEKFIRLLSKKFAGQLSTTESELLDNVIEENQDYRLLSNYLEQRKPFPTNPPIWEMITAAEGAGFKEKFNYEAPKSSIKLNKSLLKIAAILVLSVLGYYLFNHNINHQLDKVVATDEKVFKMLADGTKIWLNKESTLSYNQAFGESKRELTLVGEAYFDVAKNKNIPLIIHAGSVDIEVKGTAFNVNAYPQQHQIQVALLRGAVEVVDRLGNHGKVLLHPNQKLIFNNSSNLAQRTFQLIAVEPSVLLKEIRWTADTLIFSKEKLKDLAMRLEKKYDLKIEIKNEALQEKRFSGMFTTESIQQALEALKLSYPLTYTINNRVVVIRD